MNFVQAICAKTPVITLEFNEIKAGVVCFRHCMTLMHKIGFCQKET